MTPTLVEPPIVFNLEPFNGWLSIAGSEAATKWGEVIDELLRSRLLTDDWDGQGAKAPTSEVVEAALNLAHLLRRNGFVPPDDYGPGVTGTMTLGWHTGIKSMVVEVSSPLQVEGYRWTKGDERAEQFVLLAGK